MKPANLMKHDMEKLSFVNWDRYVEGEHGHGIDLFGWIKREDTHEDFVLLKYTYKDKMQWDCTFCTSSKEYSKKIAELLEFESYNTCTRVEFSFPDTKNCIRLIDKRGSV